MKQSDFPSYKDVSRALAKVAEEFHASEMHGLICGLLCGNPKDAATLKNKIVANDAKSADDLLQQLFDATSAQLKEFLFDLPLLLPADSEKLEERAEALTLWVQGFLTGLKMTEVNLADAGQSEAQDAYNDLVEIAQMNYEEVVASEEDEAAFVELAEYVRMATIMIYQELREKEQPVRMSDAERRFH